MNKEQAKNLINSLRKVGEVIDTFTKEFHTNLKETIEEIENQTKG